MVAIKTLLSLGGPLFFSSISFVARSQSWSISKKSGEIAFGAIVYIESSCHHADGKAITGDILRGSAFLIADSDKVYLVTAKHLVKAKLYSINQRHLNNNITINTSWKSDDDGIKLPAQDRRHFILYADNLDIAII